MRSPPARSQSIASRRAAGLLPPLAELFRNRHVLLTGATGFLGKVVLYLLLREHPELRRISVLIRGASGADAQERFRKEIVQSPVFASLQGEGGEARRFARVEVVCGDITEPNFGLAAAAAARLRRGLDAIIHVAGLVDFAAPLDRAYRINVLGTQHALDFAHAPGRHPIAFVQVSTCYVAGRADGRVDEDDVWIDRAPRGAGSAPFSVEREMQDCEAAIARCHAAAGEQVQQAAFEAEARAAYEREGDDSGVDERAAEARRRWLDDAMREEGVRRAEAWGWPNTYTYTKSLAEQLVLKTARQHGDRLRAVVVRPAIIESALADPFPGWNQGVNTSAPLVYVALRGQRLFPFRKDLVLDVIPVDLVAHALICITGATLAGRQRPIYQLGTGAVNPLPMWRLVELTGLANRRASGDGRGWATWLAQQWEPVASSQAAYDLFGGPALRRAGGAVGKIGTLLTGVAGLQPLGSALANGGEALRSAGDLVDRLIAVYRPYTNELRYRFSIRNMQELTAHLQPDDRARHPFRPEALDWRTYWTDIHVPGLRRWSFPDLDRRTRRRKRAPAAVAAPADLRALLELSAARFGSETALAQLTAAGTERITYAELHRDAERVARWLCAAGVRPRHRVVLLAESSPDWVIGYFGIAMAGATAVPLDPELPNDDLRNLLRRSQSRCALVSPRALERSGAELRAVLEGASISTVGDAERAAPATRAPRALIRPGDVASLVFTSGTTGTSKGVMLTHANLMAQVRMLAAVFRLGTADAVLSVLPLHHTFEFTCGLLLPLAQGASVTYLERLDAHALASAFTRVRPTAMIGVPALWQTVHRRLRHEAAQRLRLPESAIDAVMQTLSQLRRETGVSVAPWLLRAVHERFGGRLRLIVSGAAPLPREVWGSFHALGLDVCEGYGLTEAGPVLSVQRPGEATRHGDVGLALAEVELRIAAADADGAGEVLARSPSVMLGYYRDRHATRAVVRDGWLHTGDIGRIDAGGRLAIVGRRKELIIDADGKNVAPEEIEERYANAALIRELAVVGVRVGGGEQVAALIVPADATEPSEQRRAIREHLAAVSARLPFAKRIKVWRLWSEPLPRTATRKLRRAAVRELLAPLLRRDEGADTAAVDAPGDDATADWLVALLAAAAGVDAAEIHGGTHLVEDLGLDSLALVELGGAIEERGVRVVPEALAGAMTVGELSALLAAADPAGRPRVAVPQYELEPFTPRLPQPVSELAKRVVGAVQDVTYAYGFDTRVFGRGNIPHDRNVLVVANHSSHLDVGLVRHALGAYGRDLVTLAARDYFFETPLARAYFSNFTNLVPFERSDPSFASLEEAVASLRRGRIVLLFPEGTRASDGRLQAFKPGVGYIVARAEVDVLPVYLDGTHAVLPKGAVRPRGRRLAAYIGAPVRCGELQARVGERRGVAAYRVIAEALQAAVAALRPARAADSAGARLRAAFEALPARYAADGLDTGVSFYFVLGESPDARWTVWAAPSGCRVAAGKHVERADCVLKTSADVFLRIVEEGYTPPPSAFTSGAVKTNDPDRLRDFQRLFRLG